MPTRCAIGARQQTSSAAELINPRDYRSFCFRGEGRMNFVISAKCERTSVRIVWRFAKQRKSGLLTVKAKSEMVNDYMNRLVTPFFNTEYLVSPRMIMFKIEDVHQLAKIPSLPANRKVETFEELLDLPAEMSFLPTEQIPKDTSRLTALEMLDATRIPKNFPVFLGSTITVEIKPKQGFYQQHAGFNLRHCNNCVLQIEKCSSDAFDTMYDFCPLDLYSGNLERMRHSIEALLRVPHRNLRLFVNGDVVHSDEHPLGQFELNATVFPDGTADMSNLVDALCCALARMPEPDRNTFHLSPDSVLGQLLRAQQMDTIGIAEAHKIYLQLPQHVQDELKNAKALSKRTIEYLSQNSDRRSLLERYLLAATMKDCSVMISLRRVPKEEIEHTHFPGNIVRVGSLCFACCVKVVDLDPKSTKNLVNAYERFEAGALILEHDPKAWKPCI